MMQSFMWKYLIVNNHEYIFYMPMFITMHIVINKMMSTFILQMRITTISVSLYIIHPYINYHCDMSSPPTGGLNMYMFISIIFVYMLTIC